MEMGIIVAGSGDYQAVQKGLGHALAQHHIQIVGQGELGELEGMQKHRPPAAAQNLILRTERADQQAQGGQGPDQGQQDDRNVDRRFRHDLLKAVFSAGFHPRFGEGGHRLNSC